MKAFAAGLILAVAPAFAASLQLVDAVKAGQRAAAIDMLAKKSADVNAAEADGSTALLWAANMNDLDLAARLLKAGANPKVHNLLGSTPLAEAAFQISHALTNFYKLDLPETHAIRKFEDHRCRKLHRLMGTARSSG